MLSKKVATCSVFMRCTTTIMHRPCGALCCAQGADLGEEIMSLGSVSAERLLNAVNLECYIAASAI